MTTTFTGLKPCSNLKSGQVFNRPRLSSFDKARPDRFVKTNQPLFAGGSQREGPVCVEDSPRPSLLEGVFGFIGFIFFEKSPLHDLLRQSNQYSKLKTFLESDGRTRLTEYRDWSGKSYLHYALEAGNYKGALLLASHGANPAGLAGQDSQGHDALFYVNQRKDLTEAGKKLLKNKLVELFKMRTEVQEHPGLYPAIDEIPKFVRDLPRNRRA